MVRTINDLKLSIESRLRGENLPCDVDIEHKIPGSVVITCDSRITNYVVTIAEEILPVAISIRAVGRKQNVEE